MRTTALLALAVTNSVAYGVPLVDEHFLADATPIGPEYTTGNLVPQDPLTVGFTGPWFTSAGSTAGINGTSLNYTGAGYPAETGGRMLSPTGDSRVHRMLGPSNPFESTDSGTVYMSFLLQTGTNNGYRAFEMHNGGNSDAAHRTLQIGLHNGGDFPLANNYGFRVNNNSGLEFSLGAENSGVNLFLVKFVLSTTNNADSITVWNNPSLAGLPTDPTGGVTATGFNFAADRLGAGHFAGTQYSLDELRIGTTITDVFRDFLTCDVNGNGVCNSSDIDVISENMYLAGTYSQGDIDGSGLVDFVDYRMFKDHPARVVGFDPPGAGSETPEPTVATLLTLAGICLAGTGMRNRRSGVAIMFGMLIVCCCLTPISTSYAADQDLLNDNIGFSGKTLNLRPYVSMPAGFNNVIQMTHRPADQRMYVTTEQGSIFVVNENASGVATASLFFNAAAALQTAVGRSMNFNASQQGLQSVAFHPEFDVVGTPGYGKLYTTMLENRPANPNSPAHFYLGNSGYGGGAADGVLAEWTFNHDSGQVSANSYRELFRASMPNYDHPIKLAQFNPYSVPGDEDYGLLYITHGDSNNQDSLNNDPQDRGDVMGKMLRINPLSPSAGVRYSIPATNPFFTSAAPTPTGTPILGEVFAYGLRNPHTFSFNPDDQGNIHILVGDIGRDNIEEVNLVEAGQNYGWTKREGTFVHHQKVDPDPLSGYISGVGPLPANEATVGVDNYGTRYTFPVAQWDHNGAAVEVGADWWTGNSIATSFVIRNGSDPALDGEFIHLNFASNHGDVYHNNFDSIRNAVTQLDPNDPSRDHPSELTQSQLQRMHLTLDGDNNPATAPTTSDNLNSLLGVGRSDARFGEGRSGQMFISNKNNGGVYLVTNTVNDNTLTLTVDRGTGEMTLSNATAGEISIDRVSLFSPSGSFAPGDFQTAAGDWTIPAGNSTQLLRQSTTGELTLDGSNPVSLGNAYDGQLIGFGKPVGEDVQLLYTTDGAGGRGFAGKVVYTGVSTVPNTIVLTVDLASGKAVMLNQTPFPQEIEGYTISSTDGSLDTAGWESLDAQGIESDDWFASPPLAGRITELQEDSTTTFDSATPFALGKILQAGGELDLEFEFVLAGGRDTTAGLVQYILAGDYNDDQVVDAADYTVWRDALDSDEKLPNDLTVGAVTMDDYAIWKANFGATWSGGGSNANVPEPGVFALLSIAIGCLPVRRIRSRC